MKLLRFFKSKQKKQFVSEIDFMMNRGKQSHKAIEILVSLRELNIEEDDELKIDFYFYTDTLEKLNELTGKLQQLKYSVRNISDINNKKHYTISGQTTSIKMMHEVLRKWAMEMCELGYNNDCSFDHWEVNLNTFY